MENKQIAGGCYCGEVRFGAASEVCANTNCHCSNCRRAAGAQAGGVGSAQTGLISFTPEYVAAPRCSRANVRHPRGVQA